MAKKDAGTPFTGILAEPLDPLRVGPLADDEYLNQMTQERVELEIRKMHALLEHYSIDPTSPNHWYALALKLAQEIVPGLQEKVKRGAPKKWGAVELSFLRAEMDACIEEEGLTIDQAAGKLANMPPWRGFLSEKDGTAFGPDPAEALRRAYHLDCDERWLGLAKDARNYHVQSGDMKGWIAFLIDSVKMK